MATPTQQELNNLNNQFDLLEDKLNNIGSLLQDKLKNRISDLKDESRDFIDKFAKGEDVTKQVANKLLALQKDINKLSLKRNDLENDLLRAQQRGLTQAAASIQTAINKNKLATSLLEDLQTQLLTLSKIAEEEKKATEEKKKQNSLLGVLNKKFEEQLKTLKEMFTLGSIVDMLFKGSENIANFRKELGISYGNAYKLNTELSHVGSNISDAYITGEKLKKSFADLSKEMGFVADYGTQSLVTMTNLTGRLGMANKEAAQLTTLARFQSKDTEKVLDGVGKTVSSMNKQKGTAILLKDVMKEIGNVSMATAVSLGKSPQAIAEAVVAAKQLGSSLEQMEKTADSLLNFESSIESELKAELLTGKQLNLERARAAALSNDMKTLSEEIGKNQDVINSFAKGNRLEQQAIADSLGMSREELAKMIYQQEAQKIGAEGVRAKYGEQAYEQLKAQNAQEKFANAVEKLKAAISGVIQIFSPILDILATAGEYVSIIFSKWYLLYPLLAGAALLYIPKMAKGFADMWGNVKGMAKDATKLFSKEGRDSLFGGAGGGGEDAAKKAAGAGDKAGAGGEKAGDGIKNTLKGISSGIASFKKVSPADIAKLIGSAVGLVALTPAIPALLLLQMVNGKLIQGALAGIGNGLKAIGKALSDPRVLLGLAGFTVAMIGLGFALKLAAPAIKAVGEAVGTIITSIASGISTIVESIGDMIVKLGEVGPSILLLGPALLGVAAGLGAMSFTGLLAMPTILALTALGTVAPALASLGMGGGGGGKEEEKNSEMATVIAAINAVKASVDKLYTKDSSVNMDGKKVGTTLTQGSTKLA
jgi:hypothetical protein